MITAPYMSCTGSSCWTACWADLEGLEHGRTVEVSLHPSRVEGVRGARPAGLRLRNRLVSWDYGDYSVRTRLPDHTVQVRQIAPCRCLRCDGGTYYWEAFRDGAKLNGGIARSEREAHLLGWANISVDRLSVISTR